MCFDFTGDGRKDIVFSGWEFMNHGAHYWAAFRGTRRGWVRKKFKRSCCAQDPRYGTGIQLDHAGRTVIVTEPVFATDDPACCPSGGSREGRWRYRAGQLRLVRASRSRG